MADQTNDTQSKINKDDRDDKQRQGDTTARERDRFANAEKSPPGDSEPKGQFAQQGEAAMGGALAGGPNKTGNTGDQLPGGAQSEFARTTGGQTEGLATGTTSANRGTTGNSPAQETGAGGEPLGASHEQGADGGSVTAAGSSSTGPGAGQAGTDASRRVVGANEDSDEEDTSSGKSFGFGPGKVDAHSDRDTDQS